jgi:hypothetical protein
MNKTITPVSSSAAALLGGALSDCQAVLARILHREVLPADLIDMAAAAEIKARAVLGQIKAERLD